MSFPWLGLASHYGRRDPEDPGDGDAVFVGCNVRRLMPDVREALPKKVGKCMAFAGSTRGYAYPCPDLVPSQSVLPALILEGEIDRLLAVQEANWLVHALTLGGSKQAPHPSALAVLDACDHRLIATDHDAPVQEAAKRLAAMAPAKARRLYLPHGKDVGEFVQAGGDLAGWLESELARLGLS